MEISCKCVGMLSGGKWDKAIECNRRVYSPDGVSPTLTTCGGGQSRSEDSGATSITHGKNGRR